jgi:7SK snRNA methylphosphate capping enzyme
VTAELAWSRQAPLPHILDAAEALTSTSHAHPPHDALPSRAPLPEPRTSTKDVNYFPLSLPRMFGYLPSPKELLTTYVDVPEVETVGVTRRGKRKVMPIEIKTFPENLRFKAADWPNEEIEPDRGGYDVIVASVSPLRGSPSSLQADGLLLPATHADSPSRNGSTSTRSTPVF